MQTETCLQAFQTKEDKTFSHHVKKTWMQTEKVFQKKKNKSQFTKDAHEKNEYMNDMKLIWGTHARLICLGAKIQSRQMGSYHSNVPERVVPYIKNQKLML